MRTLQEIMDGYFKEEDRRSPLREAAITLSVSAPIQPKSFDWERMSVSTYETDLIPAPVTTFIRKQYCCRARSGDDPIGGPA